MRWFKVGILLHIILNYYFFSLPHKCLFCLQLLAQPLLHEILLYKVTTNSCSFLSWFTGHIPLPS